MSHYEKNERVNKIGVFEKLIQRANHKGMKIILASMIALITTNSFAGVTLEQGDTMYYFAKQCNEKGKTAYALTDTGQWQAYSAAEVYEQYKYMKSMITINQFLSTTPSKVTKEDVLAYLDKTRPKRIKAAKSYLACK
ncbi:hypothetical protein QTA56_12015 [Acinetobacter sp. VNH17]|uniref:Uncharacterized protein n=1 Tax=Acinetobacter thutiue TaxID=2998078 RepID=A0ABT7WQJ8_9GAMM|nr:hypothetical protein [Acinetobacter thutiue]MCY6412842.1 hypothetical protein [Acinetobacter thutiue]MDN0014949.1 hypothetical protein [Acinetobacter thutiue]